MQKNDELKKLEREYREAQRKLSEAHKNMEKHINITPLVNTKIGAPINSTQLRKDIDIYERAAGEYYRAFKKYWEYKKSKK